MAGIDIRADIGHGRWRDRGIDIVRNSHLEGTRAGVGSVAGDPLDRSGPFQEYDAVNGCAASAGGCGTGKGVGLRGHRAVFGDGYIKFGAYGCISAIGIGIAALVGFGRDHGGQVVGNRFGKRQR